MNTCIVCGNNPIVEHNHCEICLRQKAAKLKSLSKKIEELRNGDGTEEQIKEYTEKYNQIAVSIGLRPL